MGLIGYDVVSLWFFIFIIIIREKTPGELLVPAGQKYENPTRVSHPPTGGDPLGGFHFGRPWLWNSPWWRFRVMSCGSVRFTLKLT